MNSVVSYVAGFSLPLQRGLEHWAHGIEDTDLLDVELYMIYFTLHCEDLSTI